MKMAYDIRYSNRKTLGITVDRDKSIIVRAPDRTSKKEVRDFIDHKRFWIYTKLNHPQKFSDNEKKEFVSGASIMYLGRNYKLDVVNENIEGLRFSSKFIISRKNRKYAFDIFKQWYLKKAFEKIPPRVNFYTDNLGVNYNRLNIKELKYRWGSCTPNNNLNFNWRLMKAPMFAIDYVIVHELTHLLEANHTLKFWNIVKTQIPKYLQAKEWLKNNGDLLDTDF